MSKIKIIIIAVASLTLIALFVMAIPVVAADSVVSTNPAQLTQVNKAKILVRLLLVQNEAKVDAFIAKAVDANKLTESQATKLKDFWSEHHAHFLKNVILIRLLKTQDESKVQAFLDKAVMANKIQKVQADKIIQVWEILHKAEPSAATR
jgi:hypothetical protein